MKKTIQATLLTGISLMFLISSCKKDDATAAVTVIAKTDSIVVNFDPTSTFTLFSFKNDAVVANTDSASTDWDFGLRLTTFILNSHAYGPGNAGAILQNAIYSNVTAAPETGYAYDTTATQTAIKDGSWYNYNITTHVFAPIAGQTFIFRTADNFYVKMELLSVGYEPFVGPAPVHLIYHFRYTYQSDGTKNF